MLSFAIEILRKYWSHALLLIGGICLGLSMYSNRQVTDELARTKETLHAKSIELTTATESLSQLRTQTKVKETVTVYRPGETVVKTVEVERTREEKSSNVTASKEVTAEKSQIKETETSKTASTTAQSVYSVSLYKPLNSDRKDWAADIGVKVFRLPVEVVIGGRTGTQEINLGLRVDL